MKYVFLAYRDEQQLAAMPAAVRCALLDACLDSDEALRKRGHLLAAEGLQTSSSATTVRVENGRLSVAAGPCAGTKERLVGIFFIKARDLNEAIQVAATMPQARGGPIELRPVVAFDQP